MFIDPPNFSRPLLPLFDPYIFVHTEDVEEASPFNWDVVADSIRYPELLRRAGADRYLVSAYVSITPMGRADTVEVVEPAASSTHRWISIAGRRDSLKSYGRRDSLKVYSNGPGQEWDLIREAVYSGLQSARYLPAPADTVVVRADVVFLLQGPIAR